MQEKTSPANLSPLEHLIQTVHRLRAPGGCPWDRDQTHQSLRKYLIEEAYELLDVLDQVDSSEALEHTRLKNHFQEELGDVLMQVLLHAEITRETGAFDINDVAKSLDEKLVRRHPHVFGDQQAHSADHALKNWEKEKAKERLATGGGSVLDGVPKGLPSLQRAARVIEKVTKVGFQWPDMDGPLEKVQEECLELQEEVKKLESLQKSFRTQSQNETSPDQKEQLDQLRTKVESELGDLLFTICNVGYLLKLNPEDALRNTLRRFEKRFRHVEQRILASGRRLEDSELTEMDQLWSEAKKLEGTQIWGLTGGVASGKSLAAEAFTKRGIPVVDADAIAKNILSSDTEVQAETQSRFGTVDRAELRKMVFQDPEARTDLEKILHPRILQKSVEEFKKLSKNHCVILYEAALLVETGRYKNLDGLIVIEAPEKVRIQRLVTRDHISHELAKQMLSSQLSDDAKRKVADVIITNSGTQLELDQAVAELIQKKRWNIP